MKSVLTFIVLAFLPFVSNTAYAQQEHLSGKELAALVTSARTPAEHERIAAWYRAQSERYSAEAAKHAQMAAEFRKNPTTNNTKMEQATVNHCEYVAKSLKAKAFAANNLAQKHEEMARLSGGK